jgi:Glycosyl transferase family 2
VTGRSVGGAAAGAAAVSVLVPVHDQAAFLGRALASLRDQTETDWQAVVLDDGSHDDPAAAAAPFLDDPRVRLLAWPANRGLGATLNAGLAATTAPVVAYLPADDVWDPDHLACQLEALRRAGPAATLVVSGVRHHDGGTAPGAPPGHGVQLVQAGHRRTADRWVERAELESDDLGRLLWDRLGDPVRTGRVTCEWTDHPRQRHKAVREAYDGGLNVFRRRYGVEGPLRFHSTDSGLTDEVARYAGVPPAHPAPGTAGLDVLVVGELAFNPERVVALTERGHRLHGLWTDHGLGDSTVGPLPFGGVPDLPRDGWREAVRDLAPDVVWAQLNWRAVPLALAVRRAFPDLPFVWHFKESPQRSRVRGEWPDLAELFLTADATLLATEEERAWVLDALPGRLDPDRVGVLDGDLPAARWLDAPLSPRLSETDGELHTAVLGRPLGFDAAWVAALTDRGVHVHLYGQVDAPGPKGSRLAWWDEAVARAPDRLHLHPTLDPRDWVTELSRHDAGWLHRVGSRNGGDLRRATWDDLNSPARLPALLMAGLPVLLPDHCGHRVAVDRITREQGVGVAYRDADDVVDALRDEPRLAATRAAALDARHRHVFDAHVDRLVRVFDAVRT